MAIMAAASTGVAGYTLAEPRLPDSARGWLGLVMLFSILACAILAETLKHWGKNSGSTKWAAFAIGVLAKAIIISLLGIAPSLIIDFFR